MGREHSPSHSQAARLPDPDLLRRRPHSVSHRPTALRPKAGADQSLGELRGVLFTSNPASGMPAFSRRFFRDPKEAAAAQRPRSTCFLPRPRPTRNTVSPADFPLKFQPIVGQIDYLTLTADNVEPLKNRYPQLDRPCRFPHGIVLSALEGGGTLRRRADRDHRRPRRGVFRRGGAVSRDAPERLSDLCADLLQAPGAAFGRAAPRDPHRFVPHAAPRGDGEKRIGIFSATVSLSSPHPAPTGESPSRTTGCLAPSSTWSRREGGEPTSARSTGRVWRGASPSGNYLAQNGAIK